MPFNISDAYYNILSKIESNNNPNAKAKTSSASGRYQFIRSTWEGLGYRWDQVFDDNLQQEAIRAFTTQNANYLAQHNISVNNASLYAAHFLGAGTARKALTADDSKSLSEVVGDKVIQANQFLRNYTVGDFKAWLEKKTGANPNQNPQMAHRLTCPVCKTTFKSEA